MKKKARLFSFSDVVLMQHGAMVVKFLPEDLIDFIKFDSTFLPDYPAGIYTLISKLKTLKSDKVVIDEMTELTQTSNDALAACNRAFRTIGFFVSKVYKGNVAVQNQFGFNDIRAARQDHGRMIRFMDDLILVCKSYRQALIDGGCDEAVVDSLPTLRDQLQVAETRQEKFKKDRGLITQERVEKLNALYELLVPVSEMAQIMYADDPARLSRYTLPRPKSSTNSVADLVVS